MSWIKIQGVTHPAGWHVTVWVRKSACCRYCRKLMVCDPILCWRSIHSPNFRPPYLLELFRVSSTLWIFFYVLLVRVVDWVNVPQFLCNFFPFFLIIHMSNWQPIKIGYQLSPTLFFLMSLCSWLIKKYYGVLQLLLNCCGRTWFKGKFFGLLSFDYFHVLGFDWNPKNTLQTLEIKEGMREEWGKIRISWGLMSTILSQ